MQQQLNDITLNLLRYFNRKFSGLEKRFKGQDAHIEGLYQLIDAYVRQAELQEQEALAGEARMARLETQVYQLNLQQSRRY